MSSILKLSQLVNKPAADLVEFFVSENAHQHSAAVNAAKAIIALCDVTGSEANARSALKAAKVADCAIKNSLQLVWTYDSVVRTGHADETWFDGLLYHHAVQVRRAVAKVTAAKLAEWGLFKKSAKANLVEFELIADTGLNKVERVAASEKKAEEQVAAAKVKAAKAATAPAATTPATTESPATTATPATATPATATEATPATPATTATPAPESPAAPEAVAALETPKPGKGKVNVLAQFDTLIGSAEKFVGAVFPTADELTVEKMRQRVTALMVIVEAATAARKAPVQAAA